MFAKQESLVFVKCAVVAALALLTVACGEEAETNISQVVAQVNGEEITIHQLNSELRRLNAPATEDAQLADAISISVLRKLVDQQLLVSQAKELNMERDPEVVQAFVQSKQQILAQAYAKQLVGTTKIPDDKEVADYYDRHPELFKHRKTYTMRMISISKKNLKIDEIDQLRQFKTLSEAKDYLILHDIAYQQKMVTSSAEDLPIDVVPKMMNAPKGQLFMQQMPMQVTVYDVLNAIDQPVTLEQSRQLIIRFLASQANEKRVLDEIERVRKTAKIKYMGKFAGLQPDMVAEMPVVSDVNNELEALDSEGSSDSLERGLSGLK